MRNKLYTVAAISLIAGCLYFFFFLPRPAKNDRTARIEKNTKKARADYPDKALDFEIIKTMDPATLEVPRERLDVARKIQLENFAEQVRTGIQAPVPGISWTERGPDNVGGRTRAILYDLNDPNGRKVWAAGVGG